MALMVQRLDCDPVKFEKAIRKPGRS